MDDDKKQESPRKWNSTFYTIFAGSVAFFGLASTVLIFCCCQFGLTSLLSAAGSLVFAGFITWYLFSQIRICKTLCAETDDRNFELFSYYKPLSGFWNFGLTVFIIMGISVLGFGLPLDFSTISKGVVLLLIANAAGIWICFGFARFCKVLSFNARHKQIIQDGEEPTPDSEARA